MTEHFYAKTEFGQMPAYFNFSERKPGEVTLHTRASSRPRPAKGSDYYPRYGDDATFVLNCDEVLKLAHFLNGVIARFTSNA